MPYLRYKFRHPEGHELTEEGHFRPSSQPGDDRATIQAEVIDFLTAKHPEDNPFQLLTVEVLDPFTHTHSWKRTHKQGERTFYLCTRCQAIAHRRFSIVYGEVGDFIREDAWKSKHYEWCRDPLKSMPVRKSLFT